VKKRSIGSLIKDCPDLPTFGHIFYGIRVVIYDHDLDQQGWQGAGSHQLLAICIIVHALTMATQLLEFTGIFLLAWVCVPPSIHLAILSYKL
jgi:hypothetical protein